MSIMLLVVLVLFTIIVLALSIRKKSFIDKKNVFYFFPLLVIAIIVYSIGYKYEKSYYDFLSFFECLKASLKSFGFEIERNYVGQLIEKDTIFAIDIYMTTILCGLTTISTFLGIAKNNLSNYFKVWHKRFHKDFGVVIGINNMSREFVKKNKQCILWLTDSFNDDKVDRTLLKELYLSKITYYKKELTANTFAKFVSFSKKKVHVFVFSEDVNKLKLVTELISNLKIKKNIAIEFHVMAKTENMSFINQQLTEACFKNENCRKSLMASTFNIHDILGRNFSSNYNLAEFLPRNFFKDGALLSDKKIKVHMFGFGNVSEAILKNLILNNQFVTVNRDNEMVCMPVEYEIIDNSMDAMDKRIFNLFYKNDKKKHNSPLERMEFPAKITWRKNNLLTDFSIDDQEFEEIVSDDKNTFNFYFVSIGKTINNATIANRIAELDNENSVIFYNVKSENEALNIKSSMPIIPFGFKYDLLHWDYIANDDLCMDAKQIDELYNDLSKSTSSFYSRNIIEKLSNIYASVNLRFKLNLLGLDLAKSGDKDFVSEKEYYEKYYPKKEITNYADYFVTSKVNILRYQEHLRWTAFYYIYGFEQLPLEKIYIGEDERAVHKNLDLKKHACLTSYRGLDTLHRYEAKLYAEYDNYKYDLDYYLQKAETYKFDSQLLDNLYKKDPKIVKLKSKKN